MPTFISAPTGALKARALLSLKVLTTLAMRSNSSTAMTGRAECSRSVKIVMPKGVVAWASPAVVVMEVACVADLAVGLAVVDLVDEGVSVLAAEGVSPVVLLLWAVDPALTHHPFLLTPSRTMPLLAPKEARRSMSET